MKGHFYKPHCKCPGKKTKKCSCGARWSYIVDIGINPKNGKRKQKKKGGFLTKGDAETAAALLIAEIKQGSYIDESRDLFEVFSEEWMKYYESSGYRKENTLLTRRSAISMLNQYLTGFKLKEISHELYQSKLNAMHQDHKLSQSTMTIYHGTASLIFQWAIERKKLAIDPTEYAHIPKVVKSVEDIESEEAVHKYLEKKELVQFLETAKLYSHRYYIIFKILAYTGMRVGELSALKWKDINFEEGTISITKTYFYGGNVETYDIIPPKTKKSKREIVIDSDLLSDLDKYRGWQNEFRMRYRNTYHDKDFVIAKADESKYQRHFGYPEPPVYIRERMAKILKMSGIKKTLSTHSLRHTHTSLLAEAGVSLEEIMERLGHTSDATTKNIYLHITKTKKKEASQKFSELMKSV